MAEQRRVVGREHELGSLRGLVDRLPSGGVVVIEGEPGVGKTTLVDVAAARAEAAGAFVVRSGADEFGVARPLGLLPTGWGAGQREAGEVEVDDLLARVDVDAAGRACLVAFDDLQWADSASLALLGPFVRRAVPSGVLVVLAMRSWPRVAALDELLDRIAPLEPAWLRLGPMAAHELRVLGDVHLGRPVGRSVAALLEGAGGNPFYALALLRVLTAEGALAAGPIAELSDDVAGDTPAAALASLVGRRVALLGPDVERTLQHAAVLGRSFGVGELAELLAAPSPVVAEHIALAAQADLLQVDGDRMAFRHDLLREAIEQSLPPAVAAAVHRHAAGIAADRGDLALAGAHLLLGEASPADVDRMADAAGHCSPSVALGLVGRAMEMLDPSDGRYVDLAVQRVDFLLWNGDAEQAIAAARRLLDAGIDDQRAYELRTTVAHALFVLGRAAEAVDTWVAFPDDVDDVLRAGELAEMAFASLFAGRLRQAAELSERARSLADDATSTAISSIVSAWVAGAAGDGERAIAWADRALDAAPLAGETAHRLGPRLVRAMTLDQLGQTEVALAEIRADQLATRDRAALIRTPFRHATAALLYFRAGAWDDAVAEAEAGLRSAEDLGVAGADGWLRAVLALVALHREGAAPAGELLADAGVVQLGADWLWWVRALIDAARGDSGAAFATMELVATVGASVDSFSSALLVAPDLARSARGDPELAARAGTVLELCCSAPLTGAANLDRLALASAIWSDDADALLGIADRVEGYRPFDAAGARHTAAVFLAEAGDDGARQAARSALDAYELLGAESTAARLRADLRPHGVRLRSGGRARERSGWDAITATERLVVDLVADGCTNAEVAERLFVSRRTVESHLAHVYTKLGVASRADLIASARTGA